MILGHLAGWLCVVMETIRSQDGLQPNQCHMEDCKTACKQQRCVDMSRVSVPDQPPQMDAKRSCRSARPASREEVIV